MADITPSTYISETEMEVTIPALEAGVYSVSVTNDSGSGSSEFTIGVDTPVIIDTQPPGISFFDQYPSSRTIINTASADSYGSVSVKVFDKGGSISANPSNFELLDGSIGEIDNSSFNQISVEEVQFNIINISASGSVILSAIDNAGNGSSEIDTLWTVGCGENNRLINLVDFLPGHLIGTEVNELTQFFEDFLNTLYENKECNIGILEKIERLAELNDPDAMDAEYLQFFANKLGYNVQFNKSDFGNFGRSIDTATSADTEEEINKYLRLTVTNLPNWYKIKTTRNAIKIMLFSFGIIGDISYQWTNDYNETWLSISNDESDLNVRDTFPSDFYPTSHFTIAVDLNQTSPAWIDSADRVIDAIDSIRPINTVFDQIAGFFNAPAFGDENNGINCNINFKTQYVIHMPWSVGVATSGSDSISVVP